MGPNFRFSATDTQRPDKKNYLNYGHINLNPDYFLFQKNKQRISELVT